MRYESKRSDAEPLMLTQQKNQAWWTSNAMAYDWRRENPHPTYTAEWFDWVDAAFIQSSAHFATNHIPFDRLIPYPQLHNKRVLEIGCGMGLHTELIARSGAHLTSMDLTSTGVAATRARLVLRGLSARVEQMDAERLTRDFGTFDFVWAWGVIHHSSHTVRIVRKVATLLAPDGVFKGMVYHRDGTAFWLALAKDWFLRGQLRKHSVDEALWRITDGYSARFYSLDQWRDILLAFFDTANCFATGQKVDALPFPRLARRFAGGVVSDRWLSRRLSRAGTFLVFEARNPFRD